MFEDKLNKEQKEAVSGGSVNDRMEVKEEGTQHLPPLSQDFGEQGNL